MMFADFSANTVCLGEKTQFNDLSTTVSGVFVSHEWDFGDGGTSNERDPLHVYHNTSGDVKNFLVVLKATDSTSGLFQRKSKTLAIQPGN